MRNLKPYIRCLSLLLCLASCWSPVMSQNAGELSTELGADSMHLANIELRSRMMQYVDDLKQLYMLTDLELSPDASTPVSDALITTFNNHLKSYNQSLQAIDTRWSTYFQAQQAKIAEDEELLTIVAEYQQLKQTVSDTLAAKKTQVETLDNFSKAEAFILSQDEAYKTLYKEAYELSLVAKLAPQLEKVKAQEQVLFSSLTTQYESAKAALELFPVLKPRVEVLQEKYTDLSGVSAKIQEMAYKPLIQRVKDYLLGFAAVSIVLLFFNFMISKFQAWKKMRESMKQMKENMNKLNGGGNYYPTI